MNPSTTPTDNPPANPKPRILYLDILRICAFFGVICIHVASLCWYDLTLDHWAIVNFYDCVFRTCSSVTFVMISGAIFLDPARTITIKKAWSKYAARIFRMLLIWGFFYYAILQAPHQPLDSHYFYNFIIRFLSGDLYFHLWFLYMIAGLYIVTPLIKPITAHASRQEIGYFILIALICFSLAPYLQTIWPDNPITIFLNKLQIGIGGGYILYFISGYYFSTYTITPSERAMIYIAGLLGSFATIYLTYTLSINAGQGVTTYMDRMSLNVYISAIAVFILIKYTIQRRQPHHLTRRIIQLLSDHSFGIYLIHILFVIWYRDTGGASHLAQNPLIHIPLTAISIFAISFCCIWLIRKLPYIGKKIT